MGASTNRSRLKEYLLHFVFILHVVIAVLHHPVEVVRSDQVNERTLSIGVQKDFISLPIALERISRDSVNE